MNTVNIFPLSLGFSPCPNDTFIFDALVHQKITTGLRYNEPLLADVEQLNLLAMEKRLDITKLSFHAVGYVLDDYCILRSGSALGRGCGPLLIVKEKVPAEKLRGKKIAIPGRYTTAALLLKMFLADIAQEGDCDFIEMRFDAIIDAVQNGTVDAGVIIHESRFTYSAFGLECVQDLGAWWEETANALIPLGCIAARRSLGKEVINAVDTAIRKSVRYAFTKPEESLPYIQQHSQELALDVVQSHIDLYVNDYTIDIGDEGIRAINTFFKRGRDAGVLPQSTHSFLSRV